LKNGEGTSKNSRKTVIFVTSQTKNYFSERAKNSAIDYEYKNVDNPTLFVVYI
jgi:hypothetical protein